MTRSFFVSSYGLHGIGGGGAIRSRSVRPGDKVFVPLESSMSIVVRVVSIVDNFVSYNCNTSLILFPTIAALVVELVVVYTQNQLAILC